MQYLCWICWLFWVGLPTHTAYPVPSTIHADLQDSHSSSQWERYWIQYTIGLLSVTVTAFTLVGCLCCQRHRRPKGFQDKAEKCKQEFKDGNSIGHDSAFEHSVDGLELDVPRMLTISDRVQFEPLPVDRIISGRKTSPKPKPLPLSTSFYDERDPDSNTLCEPCGEWFAAKDLYVPREKLKYLREIGHGWFGKVVEGRADLDETQGIPKSGGVVVRILTEEATTKEKAWFLGEATPYLKLRHQNILALLGFCLETDPYLLLFESCPAGDIKGFLLSNRDRKSQEALKKENIPARMALDIAAGLKHMHSHGFVHTDLSARNCLVAPDLSAKLGDYGVGVEKYPEDYYVVGDRALPIRWSAPESVECTDTTIETREITSQANMWSYAILLWEIVTWGERPYNDMSDEQVIQMLLSLRADRLTNGTHFLQTYLESCPTNIHQAIQSCLDLNTEKRPNLDEVRQILLNEHPEYLEFGQKWADLEINTSKHPVRSASLQDLRGSIDSDYWTTIVDDAPQQALQSSFRLGPDEPVKNVPKLENPPLHQDSGSETEEESWKGRIEQGMYTEKVKQKSKSVTDLMVLVHIDFDSDAELSMGAQGSDKHMKKKLPTTGSDSDLRHNTHTDEFDEALRKLRDPLPNNTCTKIKLLDNSERPKLLTLTVDQAQMPILRLSLENKGTSSDANPISVMNASTDPMCSEKHVLRLLSKGDPNLPLLRYVPDTRSFKTRTDDSESHYNDVSLAGNEQTDCFSNNFSIGIESDQVNLEDVILWNHTSNATLEEKISSLSKGTEFNEYLESSSQQQKNDTPELVATTMSVSHVLQARRDYSIYNADEDFSNGEDLDVEHRCLPNEEEEERKQLSTPDDEQSSDSGFRDKESCEEEENVCPSSVPASSVNPLIVPPPVCTEEEQLQILFELDTILDAEYYATLPGPQKLIEKVPSPDCIEKHTSHLKKEDYAPADSAGSTDEAESARPLDLETNATEAPDIKVPVEDKGGTQLPCLIKNEADVHSEHILQHDNAKPSNLSCSIATESSELYQESEKPLQIENENEKSEKSETDDQRENENEQEYGYDIEHDREHDYEHEDEDSSTMSLRSDNSYVSFGMEEEFVTAIRNELREKLPCAQMPVVEPLEAHDDDNPSICGDIDTKQWEDEDSEESCNQGSGGVGISIRYNVYGTPLSPILEERESTVNSESLMSNSGDASIASKESVPSEDVLLVDTRTNKMILLEGLGERLQEDDRDTTNGDLSEEENLDYTCSLARSCEDKSHIMIPSGGAPLPSPEEESKWQQLPPSFPLPLPLPLQDDLISTSFATGRGWGSQDEDDDEEEEEEDEDNSSSSGEFIWKRYDEPRVEQMQIRSNSNCDEVTVSDANVEDDMDAEDEEEEAEEEAEEEEEEFTPSAWNATLAPHRSALRSPDKTLKSGDQKKSVWFKKQRYHCVYEYPKETLASDGHVETTTTWEPTSYTDWEEMMDEPRLDLYALDYDDSNRSGNDEFFVSSSNRPFQFPASDTKYVSQFFPGATSTSIQDGRDEVDNSQPDIRQNNVDTLSDYGSGQQYQLGELRHTRDRLKLNLLSTNGTSSTSLHAKQMQEDGINESNDKEAELNPLDTTDSVNDQSSVSNPVNDNVLPKVPREKIQEDTNLDPTSSKSAQCDSQEKVDLTGKCSVLAHD